jgi:hypothetical protein
MSKEACTHLLAIETMKGPKQRVCEECVQSGAEIGERWLYCYPDDQMVGY